MDGPSYREAKGGALRRGRVAERWDKFSGSRVWLLSSAIRSRPLPLLRAGVKGSGQECPLYTNQSSARSTNPRSFAGRMPWHFAGSVRCVGVPSTSLRAGHIIQVTSIAGRFGPAGRAPYAAAKFGVEGFSESLSKEIGPLGVKVTIIEPGGATATIDQLRSAVKVISLTEAFAAN